MKAPGHNPAKLTVAQVGNGWRLLDREEIKSRRPTLSIQRWIRGERLTGRWTTLGTCIGNDPNLTYRTQLTRDELANTHML